MLTYFWILIIRFSSTLKAVDYEDYYRLEQELAYWNQKVCNLRVHGTTQRIPAEVFLHTEQPALIPLPALRYESSVFLERKVNAYGHIAYGQNFYSVPYQYAGECLTLKVSDQLLRVYKNQQVVALHTIHLGKGEFITQEAHKPPYKQYGPADQIVHLWSKQRALSTESPATGRFGSGLPGCPASASAPSLARYDQWHLCS